MLFSTISFIISAACLFFILSHRVKHRHSMRADIAAATADSVRISFFLCLCAVPFLALVATVLNSSKYALYMESAVTVEGAAALLIGLMALLQRYGALFFKMKPAMERNEILVLILLPVAMYLCFLPENYVIQYYLGPALYSLYLLRRLVLDPQKKA